MRFEQGQSGHPEGRPKGSKDKYHELRSAILDGIADLGAEIEKKKLGKVDRRTCIKTFVMMLMAKAAIKEPGNLLRTLTSLLPRQIRADLSVAGFHAELLRTVRDMDRVTMPGMSSIGGDDDGNGDGSQEP